ncbi:MAG: S8 family serine peptidase [bacterium]
MKTLPTGMLLLALAATALAPLAVAAAEPAPGPARLVVSFHALPSDIHPQSHYLGATVLAVDGPLGFAVVQADDAAGFRQQAHGRAEVRAVEDDPLQPLAAFLPSDPEFGVSQYGPQLIGAPAAWDVTLGSADVTLCIVDTGARMTHQDLAAHAAGGIDLVNGDSDPSDDNGHGTHVTGIAAAVTGNGVGIAGIAQSSFKAAKVLDASGNGYMSTVATGIRWCADNGAKVISMSLGSTTPSTAVEDAVNYAWNKGTLLAAAAGNGACTGCVQYPAAYANVIAVGCVDQNRAICSFTSQGPEVDLAAPGNAIQSTWFTSDTALMRAAGTSMSTPHVAGAAALVWAAHPGYTNAQVRQALESSAQDVGAAGKDAAAGFGLVRPDLAIAANVTAMPPPPPPATHGVAVSPASQAKAAAAKGTVSYTFTVQNTGSVADSVSLTKVLSRTGWTASLSVSSLTLQPGESGTVVLTVTAPQKSPAMTVTITAAAAGICATATAQTTIGK